jgi:hypothetical protein
MAASDEAMRTLSAWGSSIAHDVRSPSHNRLLFNTNYRRQASHAAMQRSSTLSRQEHGSAHL